MKQAPIPSNEKERLLSLHKLGLLDTRPEERFDRITRTATKIFNVPISTLTLVDAKREWFKSCQGLPGSEGDRAISFCGHALLANKIFVIPDTKKDVRFSDNPMVVGKPYIRFYAGVPIVNADGQRVGVFCIKDIKPRIFPKQDEEVLSGLAAWAELEVNSRNLSLALGERKKAEQKLIEEKTKGEAILESIGDCVVVVNTKNKIILMNQQAQILLHCKVSQAIGKQYVDVWTMLDKYDHKISLNQRPIQQSLLSKKIIRSSDFRYAHKEIFDVPVAITVAPIILNGRLLGVIDVFRDITKEKELEKLKDEFVSVASHELRTPLTAIGGLVSMILGGEYGLVNSNLKQPLKDVNISSQRLIHLVNDLLSLSRIQAGRMRYSLSEFSVADVISQTVRLLQPLSEQKKLQFKTMELEPIVVQADSDKVKEILNNLIGNSLKFTDRGSITISVKSEKDKVNIYIVDTGIGITKDDQSKLFGMFEQLESSKDKPASTGLGLHISREMIRKMGGELWIEKSEAGAGSTFAFSLPVAKSPLAEKIKKEIEKSS